MRLKVITLNIEHGGVLMERVLSFLQEEMPDILLLQEAQDNLNGSKIPHFNTMEELRPLNYEHVVFRPHYEVVLDDVRVRHGPAILSKFPLIFQKHIFFDVEYQTVDYLKNKRDNDFSQIPQSMLCASVNVNGKTLDLSNVHGIWGTDGNDSERRSAMINKIIAEINPENATIIAGDFNMQPNTHAIALLEKHLNNVFGAALTTTFNMKRKTNPGYATAVVDMIFVSKSIKVLSAECPQVEISDHLPLIAELEL